MPKGRGNYKSLDQLRAMSDDKVRELYKREWKNYRRRIERMKMDEYLKNSPTVLAYKNRSVISLKEAEKEGLDIRMELNQLLRESSKKTTEIKYARKSMEIQIQYYKDKGYDWVNKGNVFQFQAFLDTLRLKYGALHFDSEEAAYLFREGERLSIDTKDLIRNYDEYQANRKLLESKPSPRKPKRARTIKDVRRWNYEDGLWRRR